MNTRSTLGEHREIHGILGLLKKDVPLDGYVKNNLIELVKLISSFIKKFVFFF